MDSLKIKFLYNKPISNFFCEQIRKKELTLKDPYESKFIWTNNYWRKKQKVKGLYTPKFWIEKDFRYSSTNYFVLEFSAPKLLFGENVTALKESDLMPLVKKISEFCQKLGVSISKDQILQSKPTLLAMARNVNLVDKISCESVIESLLKFDYKQYSKQRVVSFLDLENAGMEIIFSTSDTETFKIYSKNREIMNTGETVKEKKMANEIRANKYSKTGFYVNEILRAELTLKDSRKIRERLWPFLGKNEPTLENLFKPKIWEALIKEEINKIYNHPLKNFVFLSLEQEPFIETFLDQNYSHIKTKDTILGIISSLQKKGIAQTRKDYLEKHASRQTWYNYVERLKKLERHIDPRALSNLSNFKIHSYFLKEFGIEIRQQGMLGFDFNVSKKIDAKPRNTM
jgi:hypothetical protein